MKFRYFLLVTILLSSCSKFSGPDFCGTVLLPEEEWIESEIIDYELSVCDSSFAFIRGRVLSFKSYDINSFDTIFAANVFLTDTLNNVITGDITNYDGEYSFCIYPGTYNLHYQFISANRLLIKNLKFNQGELITINVVLGQGHGITEFCINKNNEFTRLKKSTDK